MRSAGQAITGGVVSERTRVVTEAAPLTEVKAVTTRVFSAPGSPRSNAKVGLLPQAVHKVCTGSWFNW